MIADARGAAWAIVGDPDVEIYPRSAVKPFQAAAVVDLLGRSGLALDERSTAIACASHQASSEQLEEAARLLARSGSGPEALGCPPAGRGSGAVGTPDGRLRHNCSGKHAAFLLAETAAGGDPARYLDPSALVQREVVGWLADASGDQPRGPGVDGCGAPAWRVSLAGLARSFARLAAGDGTLGRVRAAMTTYPGLVGGDGAPDTALMRSCPGVVAKRGAEGVLAAGWVGDAGPRGAAVKIVDGAGRATGPALAALLAAAGATPSVDVRRPTVLGGGKPHGVLAVFDAIEEADPVLTGRLGSS